MRLLLLFLLAATPAWSQSAPAEDGRIVDPPAQQQAEPGAAAAVAELSFDPVHALQEVESTAAAAQPTVQGFLYQVFVAAVTALVTALIWRAVF